jgi:hypothetical protein
MIKIINGCKIDVLELETDIFGLKFKPQMTTPFDNDADSEKFHNVASFEVSDQNFKLMELLAKNYCTYGVMEIGVSRNGERSFTKAILNNKPDHVPYLGVDLDDKTYLFNENKKIYTLRENSFNQKSVRAYMKSIGMNEISLLFIDGWHSVNAVINDWMYADFLSKNGVVVFHDTNYHPGPAIVAPAIDNTTFDVRYYFENSDDYGMVVAYRI